MTGFSVVFMSRMNILRKGCFNPEEGGNSFSFSLGVLMSDNMLTGGMQEWAY